MLKRALDFILTPIPAVGFLIGGLVVFFGGFLLTQTERDFLTVVKEGYSNFGIELISIAATVLVIDRLNQRRADKERLHELILQMRSKDNGLAVAAVEILRFKGWLDDGSLNGRVLNNANLSYANLVGADLRNTWFCGANFKLADLGGAKLCGANLDKANLKGTRLVEANLANAYLSVDTVLPDGTQWTPQTDMRRFTHPSQS